MRKLVREKLYEGAWGHAPLANDAASDWKWKFGDLIMKEIKSKVNKGLKAKNSTDDERYLYYAIGIWEFFKKRLDTQYSFFSKEEISEIDDLMFAAADKLLKDSKMIDSYDEPEIIRDFLTKYRNKL